MPVSNGRPATVAYVSTYPPRQCGLASFTQDLVSAVNGQDSTCRPSIIAVTDAAKHRYEPPVTFEIRQDDPLSFRRAADYVNRCGANLVCVQHEFGIFGGLNGEYLLPFLESVAAPVVVTLHTLLSKPDRHKLEVIRHISRSSSALVVLATKGAEILVDSYGVPQDKIWVIPHGVPAPSRDSRSALKKRFGLTGRKIITTFGLLGPGKGIEYVLMALPEVTKRHPEVLYLILGQTHPVVQRREGEAYRERLIAFTRELGLSQNVRFVGTYLTKEQLLQYLTMSDIYVTPYINKEQISSGTLAYALAMGKAIVSTRYTYAEEVLAGGRGVFAEFCDPRSIAGAITRILDSPRVQRQLEERAAAYGAQMQWPLIARRYRRLFTALMDREAAGRRRAIRAM